MTNDRINRNNLSRPNIDLCTLIKSIFNFYPEKGDRASIEWRNGNTAVTLNFHATIICDTPVISYVIHILECGERRCIENHKKKR